VYIYIYIYPNNKEANEKLEHEIDRIFYLQREECKRVVSFYPTK
jgi:hypothetical protein